jgi:hypothetical protein
MAQLTGRLGRRELSPSLTDVLEMADGPTALRRIAARDVMGKIVLVP